MGWINCSRCNSSGQIVAIHRENLSIYGFLCECGIAKNKNLCGVYWNHTFFKDFKPDFDTSVIPGPKKLDVQTLRSDPEASKNSIEEDLPF